MTFLERMADASRERVRAARAKESEAALERRALAQAPAPALRLDDFDVIAELKLRSPAAGSLATSDFDAGAQLASYVRGGAVAVSVLTEPTEFRGDLAHLAAAADELARARRPAMRKDFLVDVYQVLEARAAGAGGVLVILAMLDDAAVREIVSCAQRCGMFVLLEAFDRADLERLSAYDAPAANGPPLLAGVNCRDLRDLNVRFERFAELGPHLPRHLAAVAESGIGSVADVEAVVAAGFRLALVGSSLMRAADSAAALAKLVAAGRAAVAGRQARCS
ncbi:MAG TPA: indole-3-glycerol-phosphate synthase TrpC [Gammaproteobacteria bacterium]|nr:indole-3-glycerol-phosphate synthase TrpC [Gammaproteobacteria bacterium]